MDSSANTRLLLEAVAATSVLASRNFDNWGYANDEAVTHGCTSKGPWVMSSSQAVHEALSVEFLTGQGLVSLTECWQKLTAKIRTA